MTQTPSISNADLARVGRGTPVGEWFRRYWLPVGVSEELRDIPQVVKVLGEDLVLFRDGQGTPGLLGLHCPHRGASLEYGDLEPDGIRCAYHGWAFRTDGQCYSQPGEPKDSTFHQRVRHLSYPVQEMGGLLFAYLGPDQDDPPPLTRYAFLVDPHGQRQLEPVRHMDFNWFNLFDNASDPAHLWILHRFSSYGAGSWGTSFFNFDDPPTFDAVETEFGIELVMRKPGPTPDAEVINKMSLALPGIIGVGDTAFVHLPEEDMATSSDGFRMAHVLFLTPNDDDHFMIFTVDHYVGPDPEFFEKLRRVRAREVPKQEVKPYDHRKLVPFRGAVRDEDYVALSTQGSLGERSERLGASDRGVILLRKVVRQAIEAVQAGQRPKGLLSRDQADRVVELDTFVGIKPKEIAVPVRAPRTG